MYVRCKYGDTKYIIDAEREKVYKIEDDYAIPVNESMDSFIRFRPYLKVTEETEITPNEIIMYEKKRNGFE